MDFELKDCTAPPAWLVWHLPPKQGACKASPSDPVHHAPAGFIPLAHLPARGCAPALCCLTPSCAATRCPCSLIAGCSLNPAGVGAAGGCAPALCCHAHRAVQRDVPHGPPPAHQAFQLQGEGVCVHACMCAFVHACVCLCVCF